MSDSIVRVTADVCIVGAGISGLNAAYVASEYLGPTGEIALIDRRPAVGGMWNETYDYVRLHQPHPFFTAGAIPWNNGRERSYLATKHEVIDHLSHCLDEIARRTPVTTFLGWSYVSHTETDGGVDVYFRRGDEQIVVSAARLVKAFGLGVSTNSPLALTSTSVRSVSPDTCDVRSGEIGADDAPVWIVGGGKTAMDTAHALITSRPGREVNMLAGSGTFFADRGKLFPGRGRWTKGVLTSRGFTSLAREFDGANEREALAGFSSRYGGLALGRRAEHYMFGVLSRGEHDTIAGGLTTLAHDHLADVADVDRRPVLRTRAGLSFDLAPNSWIINCTGYLNPKDEPYEPFSSPSGRVLSINRKSWFLSFPSYLGYFGTHLMFHDALTDPELYEFDTDALMAASKPAFACTFASLSLHNLSVMYDALPAKVFAGNGLDFDRWYPLPRRLLATAGFVRSHRRDRAQTAAALDIVRTRFGVRCGPLVHEQAGSAAH